MLVMIVQTQEWSKKWQNLLKGMRENKVQTNCFKHVSVMGSDKQ